MGHELGNEMGNEMDNESLDFKEIDENDVLKDFARIYEEDPEL
jgi:hypothetical protein